MLEKGLVQIYTGNGKGKTTAAFGLALRAAGHGNKVLIYQFLKPANLELGERAATGALGGRIRVEALDAAWDMKKSFEDEVVMAKTQAAISEALERLAVTAEKRLCDCLILDEIVFCAAKGLARVEDIKTLVRQRDRHVEIVMTGRGATEELMELADLVTEMRSIKHPFDTGVPARRGIEY